MNIKYLPKESQPREKLLSRGAQALSDAELLAIFLRTGTRGMNAIELADYLIAEFGSLRKLLGCDIETFCKYKGLGEAKFVQMQAFLEMTQRYLAEILKKEGALTSSEQTRDYLVSLLREKQREVFLVLYLNSQHQVICDELLFEGTIDSASIYPREVVKQALTHNAAALIFAHNHPSGNAEPSQSDIRITRKLSDALSLVEIKVLDHFIVGEGEVISFAERGLL